MKRRSLLKSSIMAGLLPFATSVEATNQSVQLGDFEDGFDDWQTESQNSLSRFTEDDLYVGVTSGDYGLHVEATGDPQTKVYKKEGLEELDFRQHPYIFAYVLRGPVDDGSAIKDMDLDFGFRFYFLDSEQDHIVAIDSTTQTVSSYSQQYITFDMSNKLIKLYESVDDHVNVIPKRLELYWEPSDILEIEQYSVEIAVDNIACTESINELSYRKLSHKLSRIVEENGQVLDKNMVERSQEEERGELVCANGYSFDYSITVEGGLMNFQLIEDVNITEFTFEVPQ